MKTIPKHFTDYGSDVMSNFDRCIEHEVAEAIKGKDYHAGYAGWHFNGRVWWEDDQWHCAVKTYASHVATFSEDSLDELRITVSDNYGYE